jgi:putative restriction endonuclease
VCENPSEYLIIAPIYIVDDNATKRKFTLSAAPGMDLPLEKVGELPGETPTARRVLQQAYRERSVRERLHQAKFRRDVLAAYRTRCAVCELRLRPLLDAAHIIPDKKPGGKPEIQNGLSMCSLHHRAFDRNILLVEPNYAVRLGKVPIAEEDQAAVRNIREFEGKRLWLPKRKDLWPDPERLKDRLEVAS